MAYNNQEKDNRPKAPFDLFDLTLWAPSTAPGKSAMFMVDADISGKVTFTVRTGDPTDKEKAKDGDVIRMKMKSTDFEKFVDLFGMVLRSKEPKKECAVALDYFRFNKDTRQRERLDTPREGNKLFIVKDSEGKIALALTQWKRTEIEFGFLPSRPEFVFKHGDGSNWTDAEMSQSAARAYHKILGELAQRIELSRIRQHQVPDLYKPPYVAPQGGGQGGGGGGYQQNRNNNGGGNSGGGARPAPAAAITAESDLDDDDIPY